MEVNNNCLVALMNNKTDFEIANTDHWYRIPIKSAPEIVKRTKVKYITFYHTTAFEIEKYTIRFFAEVKKISIVKRKELFTDVPNDPKRDNEYYKIEFGDLKPLSNVIISQRHRRILFISTTEEKLFNSSEINFLFNDSPLEEQLWLEFVKRKITAERQYLITYKKDENFFLDFAVFCKIRNINIECDGDTFHTEKEHVHKDKKRSNALESKGWSVLRFTRYDIDNDLKNSVSLVNDTITKYGGLEDVNNPGTFIYLDDGTQQMKLFK